MIKNILGRITKIEKRLYKIQCCTIGGGTGGGTGDFDAIVDFSVNIDPNDPGTTFNPDTPELTTVLYVSTINNSQWIYNGVSYVTYSPSFWRVNGNTGTLGIGKVGTTDSQQLNIITNNLNRINIAGGGTIGFGANANGIDRTYTSGDSLTSGTIKTNTGISIGTAPPAIGSYKSFIKDATTVRTRMETTSDPAAGLGRIVHEMTYTPTGMGWRYGLNTGGISGGYYPSLDFTIDEISGPVFRNVVRIQKTTGFVGIGGGDFFNASNNPTVQLDVTGEGKFSLDNTASNMWLGGASNPLNGGFFRMFGTKDDVNILFRRNNTTSGWLEPLNTSFGVGSLSNNPHGSNNSAFGSGAIYRCIGNGNSSVGYFSGQDIVNSSQNSFFGNNTAGGIVSGSGNSIFGANVTGLSAGLTNNIILADGTGNKRLQVDDTGAFAINGSYGNAKAVLTSAGTGAATAWVTPVDEEIPGGTKDGVNTAFTLAHTPITGSTKLYVRGLRLQLGVDYSIAGANITILTALLIPGASDTFFIDYKY